MEPLNAHTNQIRLDRRRGCLEALPGGATSRLAQDAAAERLNRLALAAVLLPHAAPPACAAWAQKTGKREKAAPPQDGFQPRLASFLVTFGPVHTSRIAPAPVWILEAMNDRGLLPLWYNNNNTGSDRDRLSTTPRDRSVIDENASSFFHTRSTTTTKRRRVDPLTFSYSSDDLLESRSKRKQDQSGSIVSSDALGWAFDERPPPSSPPRGETDENSDLDTDVDAQNCSEADETMIEEEDERYNAVVPPQHPSSDNLSVAMDWDQFGQIRIKHRFTQSSEPDLSFSQTSLSPEAALATARSLIDAKLFEGNRVLKIEFDSLGLTEIPDNVADLGNVMEGVEVQLHFPDNNLHSLSPRLFKIGRHLKVLGLRSNQLLAIPGNIGKLTGLKYLSLIHNRIPYLPHNILHLNALETVTFRPNHKLVGVSPEALPIIHPTPDCTLPRKRRQYVTPLRWLTFSRTSSSLSALLASTEVEGVPSLVPKLSELVLRSVVKYYPMRREFAAWSGLGRTLERKVVNAYATAFDGQTCGECEGPTIEPVAEVMEWWLILDQSEIPIRRRFCCGGCAERFKQRVVNPQVPGSVH